MSACGGSKGTGSSRQASKNCPNPTILEGKWESDCKPDPKNGTSQSDLILVECEHVTAKMMNFADNKCANPTANLTMDYTIKITGQGLVPDTQNIDITLESLALTTHTTALTKDFNAHKNYGIDTWKENVAQDITGKDNLGNNDPNATKGTKVFDIVAVKGNKLIMGDMNTCKKGCKAADDRPAALETDALTKK